MGLLAFLIAWLWIRFPYEMFGAVKKFVAASDQVDPLTLHLRGEFVESNLGTAIEPDGSVTVRLIAQQFNFVPQCVLVPVGRPIRFRITSADLVHRFSIAGTNDALEVVPGHISESQIQFDKPGEYGAPCHEFCGAGHYDMRSRVLVVARDKFPKSTPEERLTCASL
jgi:cytochrome c oxidase subunit II